jgi:hypothetical protein
MKSVWLTTPTSAPHWSTSQISLPLPTRSREWLKVALLECQRCHQVVERQSPVAGSGVLP